MSVRKDMEIERLKAELHTQQQACQWLKTIYERMPDTYYQADAEGRVVRASPSAETLMGYTLDELIGRKLSDFYVYPEQRRALLARMIESGGTVSHHEHQVRRKNGDIIWISTNAHLLYDEQHKVIGIEGMIRDVTEKKRMEAKLLELKTYESMKGLIGGIAHYFNNDLTAMVGELYLMRNHDTDVSGFHVERLDAVERKVFHMADIIQALLAFSEYKSGKPTCVSLQQVVQASMGCWQKEHSQEAVHIELEIPDEDIWVLCVPKLLEQALVHIFNNAAYAMRVVKGATIEVQMSPFQRDDAAWVRLNICDMGEGMDEETLERVSEPFFTTKEIGEGQGLGMSVVSGVVHQCGGILSLESTKGEGTRVIIELPIASAHSD